MNYQNLFKIAIRAIAANKMRSFLTALGIIIGIAAVMVIVGFGDGMANYITSSFQSAGTKSMTVSLTGSGSSKSVSIDEMYDIVEQNKDVFEYISPTVSMNGSVKIGSDTLRYTKATGVGEEYFSIYDYTVAKGRDFRYMDMEKRTKVCIVGSYVDEVLFDGQAVGATLRIGGTVFTVVGVLEQIDDESEEGGSDDKVYVPYSTAARLSYSGTVSSYTVTVLSEDMVDAGQNRMEYALYELLRSDSAYSVVTMTAMLDMMTEMIDLVVMVLTVIACISLVVGGIGIMNIMLVSVSERTREIGIRKALGAKERYILTQFVIEAAVTSDIGGVMGIAAGYGLSSVATSFVSDMLGETLVVSPSVSSALVAFGASALIGVVFGFLPARKAARLNPIDALRHD